VSFLAFLLIKASHKASPYLKDGKINLASYCGHFCSPIIGLTYFHKVLLKKYSGTLGMVVHSRNLSYMGGRDKRITD
jgi:hypothetical protein